MTTNAEHPWAVYGPIVEERKHPKTGAHEERTVAHVVYEAENQLKHQLNNKCWCSPIAQHCDNGAVVYTHRHPHVLEMT